MDHHQPIRKDILLPTFATASGSAVWIPMELQKLRQNGHECESVSSERFRLPSSSSLADDRWQWKVLVYPNGQAYHMQELIVYVILVAVAPDDAASADGRALLEHRLRVSLTMRCNDDEGTRKYLLERSDVTKLFDWRMKKERWTRHSFKSWSFNRWRKAVLEVRITEGFSYHYGSKGYTFPRENAVAIVSPKVTDVPCTPKTDEQSDASHLTETKDHQRPQNIGCRPTRGQNDETSSSSATSSMEVDWVDDDEQATNNDHLQDDAMIAQMMNQDECQLAHRPVVNTTFIGWINKNIEKFLLKK